MNFKDWKVDSTPDTKALKTVCDEIDSALKDEGGINLDPEYQREYKFTQQDESLLIESIIMNIPIPIIYLSSDTRKIPYVANVIDGQHRLRAVYRFLKNQFALKGLEIYNELNDKKFKDLPIEMKNKLLYQSKLTFENIHVQDNPDLEIEIFKRYNKGTHPLSRQELRHTIYISRFNLWLNSKIKLFFNDEYYREFYNISKKRYADKSAHESICIMISILYFGLNKNYSTSPEYADAFMDFASKYENQGELIEKTEKLFDKINGFLMRLYDKYNIKYPYSKEIYGVESKNYKLQIPILMIISAFIHYLLENEIDIIKDSEFELIFKSIKNTLANSYLENDFKGSNTRPSALKETLDEMVRNFLEIKEKV
ncbi:DUF262 domain-containing protein [Clostridium drakei]|uniref:GmrSD restriction endonucleases N-terminal domain-containing protein n=1 Tax=Clostridium drakei TaxID=332101 RepID=A0A2U8DP41_9CLOT|nr:DUF262 domain-containing protein [Clostridium drakei]AWI04547.1 hypothetical protein B9W14_08585 [Clostridium drakei]